MQGKRCAPPRGGGSASACIKYVLGEELTAKVEHDEATGNTLTAVQRSSLAALLDEARQRPDLGANVIWKPVGGGNRPSAIYARGVSSLATAATDMEAVSRTQPRVKQPVQHYVISLSERESETVSDEQLIRAAVDALDRAGWTGHQALFAVHRDTGNTHCHVALASVNPDTLRAWNRQSDYYRLHHALRETETMFGMEHENGLAIVRDEGLPTERIEWASLETRKAWARERQGERLEDMARSFLAESDGLEAPEDRRDRVVYALREYLASCAGRDETPLRADIHAIAAQLTATLENGEDGALHIRLMERAIDGVTVRESTNSLGESAQRFARWQPTDNVFHVRPEVLAPSSLDTIAAGATTTAYEREEHAAALRRRAWIADLGGVTRAEEEALETVRQDPGRISRDIVANGAATFTAADVDEWCAERVTADWLELSDFALRSDPTIQLLSADTQTPLYTTTAHRALEESVFTRATALAQQVDPLFDARALARAIADEESALGITFSSEQRAVCDLLKYRFALVQGDAGSGKSTLMAVQRRYCELTKREIAGFATSQLAAENLGQKASIRTLNTARAQVLESARGEEMICQNSRAIFDESSMLTLESVAAGLERVEQQGASAMFILDLAQLPNIGAGDTGRVLTAVAKAQERYAEVTQVFRQSGHTVAWMRSAVPAGGRAIRDGDAPAFRAYLQEYVDRGHVVFHPDRKSEIDAKAADVVAAVRRGVRVLAPGYSRQDCLYTNRAIRTELGLEGKGIAFRFARGVREVAVGDRVIFEKNAEARVGVLNGYTGSVVHVSGREIGVELDSGRTVMFDPAQYPHIDYGWSTTTHKSQGRGDPIVVPTLGRNDDARSAHVALTRCEADLRVHTRLDRDELLEHLTSSAALRPKDDALLFAEIVQRTGGPDTFWAQSVRDALACDIGPLRDDHRAEMEQRTRARERAVVHIVKRYAAARQGVLPGAAVRLDRRERRELTGVYEKYALESFVAWAAKNKGAIEHNTLGRTLRHDRREDDVARRKGRRL